jgi:prepilin-type N-terminal cleavage/methylation domain-containing protein
MKLMRHRRDRGFTLIELMIASAILLFGIAVIMQIVPEAMNSNLRNRYDSTSVVLAERLLDQMISQPITATQFTNADGQVMLLGGAAGLQGSALQVVNNQARINFQAPAVANYNFTYFDPNAPVRIPYEVRWAVVTTLSGPTVVSKRYYVGVWKRDPRAVQPSVTLVAGVQR